MLASQTHASRSKAAHTGGGGHYVSLAADARAALHGRFLDIAQALAGGTTNGDWEVPFGYLFAYGILDKPVLRDRAFCMRLVSTHGKLVWRLSGGKGDDAEFPVTLMDSSPGSLIRVGGSYGPVFDGFIVATRDDPTCTVLTFLLDDWPGKFKPTLRIRIWTVPASEARMHDEPMLREVKQRTSDVTGLDLKDQSPYVLYLDPGRRHRIVWMQNGIEADEQMRKLRQDLQRGQGGSVLFGVVATDVDWSQPALPAGVYLLWWVQEAPSQAPRWEVSSPDLNARVRLPNVPPGLTPDQRRSYNADEAYFMGDSIMKTGLGDGTHISFISGVADRSSFRFGFTSSPSSSRDALHVESQGWIQIAKP